MSEKLNKEIRDFFIKLGQDIKEAFSECCKCNCLKGRIHVKRQIAELIDIEAQVSDDIGVLITPKYTYNADEKRETEYPNKYTIKVDDINNNIIEPTVESTVESDLESDDDFILVF